MMPQAIIMHLIIQLVVGWYGSMGVEVEHSPADGHAIANVFDYIGDRFGREDVQPPVAKFDPPKKLTFIVTDEIQESIKTAKVNLQKQIDDFDMRCYVFSPFGKDMIKSLKISPDGFIQMAIQLAFYRLHGEPSAQYESAILRRFLHGRTETIRSCSEEAVYFCRTMLNSAASYEDKAKALRTAVAIHRALVLEAVSGQGVDRHLMGLGMATAELGLEMPKLFQDPGFTRSSYYRLSTSQMFMRYAAFFMFGPVVSDGYGICYNLQPDRIPFGISAIKSSKTDAFKLAEALEKSFLDMKEALSRAQQSSM
ncbi:hypothetical protein B566_EDAN011595 [Ephemera danica]|nr:hypothetical protein B566_EDAN011595 [Ephemera danica]